jgi:hypothetical protein
VKGWEKESNEEALCSSSWLEPWSGMSWGRRQGANAMSRS